MRTLTAMVALGLVLAAPARPGGFLKNLARKAGGDELLFVLGDVGAEMRVGAKVMDSHVTKNKEKLSQDPALVAWVEDIFQRVAAQVEGSQYKFQIHVVEEPTVNAYALPGGGIFVYRGMLDLAVSDDEVACVLGHEIGHVLRRHGMKRMRRNLAFRTAISGLLEGGAAKLAQVGANFKSMSFSRGDEDESDAIGMELAMKAGYDPSGAVTLWSRMQEKFGSKKGLGGWTSTHPSNEARINNTKKWLADRDLPLNETTVKSYPPPAPPAPTGMPPGFGAPSPGSPPGFQGAVITGPPGFGGGPAPSPSQTAPGFGYPQNPVQPPPQGYGYPPQPMPGQAPHGYGYPSPPAPPAPPIPGPPGFGGGQSPAQVPQTMPVAPR